MNLPEFVLIPLVCILIILIIAYIYKSMTEPPIAVTESFSGCQSCSGNQRSNFITMQPRRYRIPGYIRTASRTIEPINDLEQQAGVETTSTNPYWSYSSDTDYAVLLTKKYDPTRANMILNRKILTHNLIKSGWVLYVLEGCGACHKQLELVDPQYGKQCFGDTCPPAYPAWINIHTNEKKIGYQPLPTLMQMAHI